jgi:hypothetical protein
MLKTGKQFAVAPTSGWEPLVKGTVGAGAWAPPLPKLGKANFAQDASCRLQRLRTAENEIDASCAILKLDSKRLEGVFSGRPTSRKPGFPVSPFSSTRNALEVSQ